jgi:hypothetical protein
MVPNHNNPSARLRYNETQANKCQIGQLAPLSTSESMLSAVTMVIKRRGEGSKVGLDRNLQQRGEDPLLRKCSAK